MCHRQRKIDCRTVMSRRGFTMVELLVVILIIIILAALTFTLVNFSLDAERLSSGSRQIQNYLEGARDRAVHAKAPRGVRFILDTPANPVRPSLVTVSSMVYIGPPEQFSEGKIEISNDTNGKPRNITIRGPFSDTDWETNLVSRSGGAIDESTSLLLNGARIRIGDLNNFYTVVEEPGEDLNGNGILDPGEDANGNGILDPPSWNLTRDFLGAFIDSVTGMPIQYDYKLELAPAILADQEPSQLPRDIVIDLNNSRIPSSWSNTSRMDIMFSPRGTIIGNAATSGLIHLLLSDLKDLEAGFGIGSLNKTQGETLVTIVTKTGAINTHGVDPTDSDADGTADDPFRFAETGKESK